MLTSLKIARLFWIDLLIHWTFWLLPLWIIFQWDGSELFTLSMHLILIAALFGCIVLHELGHALTAREFGIDTKRIVLTPLGGIAQLQRMSQKPWEEFCIAIAGPLVNVAIALLVAGILAAAYFLIPHAPLTWMWGFLEALLALNVIMVAFNLLPAFPMDGGRVLRAMLAGAFGLVPATRIAVGVGTIVAALIAIGGVYYLGNPFLLVIGMFVILLGHAELRAVEMQAHEAAHHDTMPTLYPAPGDRRTMHVTVCVWDPERQMWVRQSYAGPNE